MFSCESLPAVLASRKNRCLISGTASIRSDITLIATSRSIRESCALYTTPMPPRPSSSTMSYLPILLTDDCSLHEMTTLEGTHQHNQHNYCILQEERLVVKRRRHSPPGTSLH